MSVEIFKAQHDFNCSDCKRVIKKDHIFFKLWPNLMLCAGCAQKAFEKKIENLRLKILEYQNMIGKAHMLSQEYYGKEVADDSIRFR